MKWLRWIGLLLILVHVVSFGMLGRFWTILHTSHAGSVTLDPYTDPYGPKPGDPMEAIRLGVKASVIAVVLLAPLMYFLGRTWPRLAPYLLLMVLAGYAVLPFLYAMTPPATNTQRAEQLKYLPMFLANCFFSVMGILLGTGLVTLAANMADRTRISGAPGKGKNRRRQPAIEEAD